jgi:thioredoxin reductase
VGTETTTRTVETIDRTDRVLVIGAGSSGLAAAKNLRDHGFDVDVVEREDDLGGNWNFGKPNSRVYESTHMISSKPFTQFPDFPMPDRDPDYLHHTQVLAYLRRYAEHFGLLPLIEFETAVERVSPDGGGWDVTLRRRRGPSRHRRYRDLVVANGHNWDPKLPDYPGQDTFEGEVMHAAAYKSSDQLAGKRVVVVGAGNTGCDIIVEAAQRADAAYHSTRRAYWYAPKYALGRPADQVSDLVFALKLPTRMTQALFEPPRSSSSAATSGSGCPPPTTGSSRPTRSSTSSCCTTSATARSPRSPTSTGSTGARSSSPTGRGSTADLVVFATGYRIRFPFLDPGRSTGTTAARCSTATSSTRTATTCSSPGSSSPTRASSASSTGRRSRSPASSSCGARPARGRGLPRGRPRPPRGPLRRRRALPRVHPPPRRGRARRLHRRPRPRHPRLSSPRRDAALTRCADRSPRDPAAAPPATTRGRHVRLCPPLPPPSPRRAGAAPPGLDLPRPGRRARARRGAPRRPDPTSRRCCSSTAPGRVPGAGRSTGCPPRRPGGGGPTPSACAATAASTASRRADVRADPLLRARRPAGDHRAARAAGARRALDGRPWWCSTCSSGTARRRPGCWSPRAAGPRARGPGLDGAPPPGSLARRSPAGSPTPRRSSARTPTTSPSVGPRADGAESWLATQQLVLPRRPRTSRSPVLVLGGGADTVTPPSTGADRAPLRHEGAAVPRDGARPDARAAVARRRSTSCSTGWTSPCPTADAPAPWHVPADVSHPLRGSQPALHGAVKRHPVRAA